MPRHMVKPGAGQGQATFCQVWLTLSCDSPSQLSLTYCQVRVSGEQQAEGAARRAQLEPGGAGRATARLASGGQPDRDGQIRPVAAARFPASAGCSDNRSNSPIFGFAETDNALSDGRKPRARLESRMGERRAIWFWAARVHAAARRDGGGRRLDIRRRVVAAGLRRDRLWRRAGGGCGASFTAPAIYMRTVDEQERDANLWACYVGMCAYFLLYAAQYAMAALGRPVPRCRSRHLSDRDGDGVGCVRLEALSLRQSLGHRPV